MKVRLALPLAIIVLGGLLAYAILQETPTGSLAGRVVAQESGNPLEATVRLASLGNVEGQYEKQSAKDGSFSFANLPVGSYTLEISSKVHSLPKPDTVFIEESKTNTIEAELVPAAPDLSLYVHQHIFTPDEWPQITCRGFVQEDELRLSVYKVDLNAFLVDSGGSIEKLLGVQSYYYENRYSKVNLDQLTTLELVKSTYVPITTRDLEGVFVQRVDLAALPPGLYLTAIKADSIQKLGWIMVTSLGLITKTVGPDMLAYAVDLKTGVPVAGADVAVYTGSEQLGSGKTGSDGILELNLPTKGRSTEETIIARNGESVAFVSRWAYNYERRSSLIYAYTDRPVYRPGQQVYFKGIVRDTTPTGYQSPASRPMTVEVRDSNDTLIQRSTVNTDDFGSYHGDIALNPEAAIGFYTISSSVEGQEAHQDYFEVAAYKKPEFSVNVSFPQKRYVRGQRIKAKVSANYYFGAPLANEDVSYTITRTPYWLWPTDEEDMAEYYGDYEGYEDYGGYGEMVAEGEVRTDSKGEAVIEFQANWPQPTEEYGWDNDQQFTIEAYVTDKSGREASGTGSVPVTRGEFAIEVTPDRYVIEPGQPVKVSILAMDYDRHPVKRQKLTVVAGTETWERNSGISFNVFQQQNLTTDDSGRASLTVSPRGSGQIHIVVKARDRKRNQIVSSAYVWSYGGYAEEEGVRYPELKIVTDKKTYNPGDTAKILINTDNPGATALLTVEGSRVYYHGTFKLTGKSTMVEIPVRSEYKPNFYVGVCFVRDKGFVNQQARAKVSLSMQSLSIAVKPNKQKYRPGELATYKITATDSGGRPADAELSVGVIDEAIYAIAEDTTTPIRDYFYAHKANEIETSFSFPQIYLSDPDKAGKPDLSLLARNIRVRKRFLDTAFWNPSVRTGSDGKAQISFRMPDNLTTWRTTIRGITRDTACGEVRNKVLAQQEFLVRLETPRFMVQTDTAVVTAMLHNYTSKTQNAEIELECPGLKLQGKSRRKISVASGGAERVEWKVNAPQAGDFELTARAASKDVSDAMQITLPVYPHGTARETLQTGELAGTGSAKTNLQVRSDSIPAFTRAEVRLAPSMAAAMLGSLDYLAQYPWGCTEQTISSFLPDVILSRALRDLGVSNPKLEAELPDMVAKGLGRLYRFQLSDGGWSWCEYGQSDPWMTAYVCYGLLQARQAGFEVNERVLRRGLGRLLQQASNQTNPDMLAFEAYVYTLAGGDARQYLGRLMNRPVGSKALALISLSYAQLRMPNEADRALNRLFLNAVSEPGMIHWKGSDPWASDDIETTALALQAVLKVSPDDPRAYQIVRWLMSRRQGDHWYSTRDTAMVLYAMTEFLKSTKELSADYDVEVLMNGRLVGREHFDRASIFQPEVAIPIRGLNKGRNGLEIRKVGTGNLYYSAKLNQTIAQKTIPATITGTGLTVTKHYYRLPSRNAEFDQVGKPVSGCRFGDIIIGKIEVASDKPLSHVLVEDFIPAGCEIIDRGRVSPWEWYYWWVGQDVRDEKISFYIDELPAGTRVLKFQMRAGYRGTYHALSAQVFAMYQPTIRSSSGEMEFTVR